MTRRFAIAVSLILCPWGAGVCGSLTDAANPLVEAARAAVIGQLGTAYSQVTLTVTGAPRSALQGDMHYRVASVSGVWPRARFSVEVEVVAHGHVVKVIPVGFALEAIAHTWVYGHAARAGTDVALLDIQQQDVDVARFGVTPVESPVALKDLRLRHGVREGTPVALADFVPVPDVDNRQNIVLLAKVGAITVEGHGVALATGNKGDIVSVSVPGSRDTIRAKVTDRGVAQVER